MTDVGSAAALLPEQLTLPALRLAAAECTACPLHLTGTQTVFGEGLKRARVVRFGEQPGDREDLEGRPFVGPAGRLLDEALEEADATAAQALLGRGFRVTRDRGRLVRSELAPATLATVHPSSILRAPDDELRRREQALFVDDLEAAHVLAAR